GCVRGGVHMKASSALRTAPQQVRFGRRGKKLEETAGGTAVEPGGGTGGVRREKLDRRRGSLPPMPVLSQLPAAHQGEEAEGVSAAAAVEDTEALAREALARADAEGV